MMAWFTEEKRAKDSGFQQSTGATLWRQRAAYLRGAVPTPYNGAFRRLASGPQESRMAFLQGKKY